MVLLWGSDAGALVVVVGWPVAAVVASFAMWFTLRIHWVPRVLGAGIVGFAFLVVVAPLLFFVSFFLSLVLFGDEDTSYFDYSF